MAGRATRASPPTVQLIEQIKLINSIWNNLYDRFKDRRYGLLFFISILSSVGVVFIGKAVIEEMSSVNWAPYLPGIIILGVAVIWRKWRRSRMPRERMKIEPLSRDEWRKARSKLVRSQKVG